MADRQETSRNLSDLDKVALKLFNATELMMMIRGVGVCQWGGGAHLSSSSRNSRRRRKIRDLMRPESKVNLP